MNEDDFHAGHLKPCSVCGRICDSLSPNNRDWPFSTFDLKNTKIWIHSGCQRAKVNLLLTNWKL